MKPTIVVQPRPEASLWNRWRITGAVIAAFVPILISLGALYVSWRAYDDQHQTDVSAQAAARRQDAELVSYWIPGDPDRPGSRLIVENRSGAPIFDVILRVGVSAYGGATSYPAEHSYYFNDIPPCSVATTNVLQRVNVHRQNAHRPTRVSGVGHVSYKISVTSMLFTDAAGFSWQRKDYVVLSSTPAGYAYQFPYQRASVSFAPASGCS